MRKEFAKLLYDEMQKNKDIFTLTGDLGFGVLDDIKRDFNDRFYNTGAAECLLIGAGVGLAEEGKIPVCYSISSFLLYRPFEFLRNYVSHELIPVKLVGSGRDKDYSHDGISHWVHDDEIVLKALPNIRIFKPATASELDAMFSDFLYSKQPCYLNLTRKI